MKIHNTLSFLLGLMLMGCSQDPYYPETFYSCDLAFSDTSQFHPQHLKLQSVVEDMATSGVPGVQLAVSSPSDGLWIGTSGMADLKNGIGIESCHITRVGSTVKTLTSIAIFMLQEEGRLNLNDPITKYLSAVQIDDISNADVATIGQLLNHSSGIFNYIQDLKFQTASLNDLVKEWSRDELLSHAKGKAPYFNAGEEVLYSNTGYVLLGDIITSVTGRPFYEFFEGRIFIPLGLENTSFATKEKVPNGIVRGYVDFYSNLEVINATYYSGWDYFTADGGLISNAKDLNIILSALFQGDLISEESLNRMLIWTAPEYQGDEFYEIEYGYGIFRIKTAWGDAYFHSGDAIGYAASMFYFPQQETTITWAVNGNYGKIDEFVSSKSAMEKIFSAAFE